MKVVYTKHAEDKLKRSDIKSLMINKRKIEEILQNSRKKSRTKYNDYAVLASVDPRHDLRIIYDIIEQNLKVITFHIARKGRYK